MRAVEGSFKTGAWCCALLAAAVVWADGSPATAGEGHRQLSAHEHGRGSLGVVIDGATHVLELEAPGADIVGFEHKARTKAQERAVAAAKAVLSSPAKVFDLPAAAACEANKIEVSVTHESAKADDHDHGGSKGKADKHGHKHDDDHAGAQHSAFIARYALTCRDTARLASIGFPYFKAFPGARSLEVTVVAPKGQSLFEATRGKPRVDLASLM